MDVTPGTPAKRARGKTKAAEATAKPTITVKKARSARKAPVSDIAMPSPSTEPKSVSSEELNGMIATCAYYLAEERNFTPGHELDDWLEAERRIRATLFG